MDVMLILCKWIKVSEIAHFLYPSMNFKFNFLKGYPDFGAYLNSTGRPMVYSCGWPAYQLEIKKVRLGFIYYFFKLYILLFGHFDSAELYSHRKRVQSVAAIR